MKNTAFKAVVLLVSSLLTVCSCRHEGKPLATSVSIDKTEMTFAGEEAFSSSVNVSSDGDWIAVAPEWIKVSPMHGSGNVAVEISGAANLDTDGSLAGTRRATVSFLGNDAAAELKVVQEGDPAKDLQRTYKKATEIQDGKAYLIVAGSKVARPVSGNYGYLNVSDVSIEDGIITMPDPENAFIFTSAEDGYTICQPDGRYLYQQGSYDSFNVTAAPESGHIWKVEFQAEGLCRITNITVGKYIQYSAQYTSFGSYSEEKGEMPVLYEEMPKE